VPDCKPDIAMLASASNQRRAAHPWRRNDRRSVHWPEPNRVGKTCRPAPAAAAREQDWLAANAPQQCIVCGKWFIRRADKVCSRDCLEKLEWAKQQKRNGLLSSRCLNHTSHFPLDKKEGLLE
jgi:hypothetical protein